MYAEANFYNEAEKFWQTSRQLEPENLYHVRCLAEFLILNDIDVQEGLELVNTILTSDPDYYDVLFFKGLALYKQGYPEQALETLKMAWDKRYSYRHDHYLAIKEVEQGLANRNN